MTQEISHLEALELFLAEQGSEILSANGSSIQFRDPETGITFTAVLQDLVLTLTVLLLTIPKAKLSYDHLWRMLSSQSGISTSNFQIYPLEGDLVGVTLTNFCKILNLGAEDQDDISSCVGFLLADVLEARQLLADLA